MDELEANNTTSRKEISTRGSMSGFLDSLSVYINKPHVVNRRLVGGKIIYEATNHEVQENLDKIGQSLILQFTSQRETNPFNDCVGDVDLNKNYSQSCIIVRDLIPKQIDKYPTLREIVQYDHVNRKVTFTPVCRINVENSEERIETNIDDEMNYCFSFQQDKDNSKIYLDVKRGSGREDGHVTLTWLEEVLLVKIGRWAEEDKLRTGQTSLRLVQVDEYNKLYNHLKQKYGLKLVEVWPERTDPQKFVYEDIAIATYLLLLWKEDRELKGIKEKQSFVDLGCGNGLLVYILSAEGHHGVGLDLRKRNIWDWYGSGVELKEEAITPSGETLFPQYDWLIGNHSDELTPWIPVMTARSSYNCCYFVLPCCHHDFDSKFNERGIGESQYQTYLQFVKKVGGACGFNVEEDTLRIPSTKRVCFIGRTRNYDITDELSIDEQRTLFINNRCSKGDNSNKTCDEGVNPTTAEKCDTSSNKKRKISDSAVTDSNKWTEKFQPRSNKEIARNCQSVSKETKERIVNVVFEKILSCGDDRVTTKHETVWNRGGSLPLASVADLFSGEILQELKSECGGLQTLLRNHNHIFQVTGGVVRLRDLSSDHPWGAKPKHKNKINPEEYFKTMLCWFHDNHPDGCPRLPDNCKYAHGLSELRPKPSKNS
ncbi:hypothetical protein SNE40_003938 [Patella caerulea]|uniref:tRNA (uracil-O(2)-)-methyltransferase n=1 Tax=Patella caerulea TaxID=87958 RepID=A0AAN8KFA6_PATCE